MAEKWNKELIEWCRKYLDDEPGTIGCIHDVMAKVSGLRIGGRYYGIALRVLKFHDGAVYDLVQALPAEALEVLLADGTWHKPSSHHGHRNFGRTYRIRSDWTLEPYAEDKPEPPSELFFPYVAYSRYSRPNGEYRYPWWTLWGTRVEHDGHIYRMAFSGFGDSTDGLWHTYPVTEGEHGEARFYSYARFVRVGPTDGGEESAE